MKREDLYPSRIGGEPLVLPRKDPVVHARARHDSSKGPLSRERLDRFEQDGAIGFEPLLPTEEIVLIERRAERLRSTASQESASVIREPDANEVRSIFAVHRSDPLIRRLVGDPRIVDVVRQLLGGNVYVHQSRINYKPAFTGKEFYWHSDFETWHVEDGMPRMHACSLSINLTENRPENGPLMFMPGSHQHYVSCPGDTPEENHKRSLRRQEIGVPPRPVLEQMARRGGIESPTGIAGSAVLFDCNLMHGSNGNITPYPRSNLFLVFNSVENRLAPPFSGGQPRPEFVASRSEHALG